MKKFIIIIITYILLSIVYEMSGLSLYSKCYSALHLNNYKYCLPLEFIDVSIQFPAIIISEYTPVKFIWGTYTKDGFGFDTTSGGLKVGNVVVFETWHQDL